MNTWKTGLLLLLNLVTIICFSQTNSYTYQSALQKAKKENKLVLINVKSANCSMCNEVASKGIYATENKRLLKENIIVTDETIIPEAINANSLYFFSPDFFGVIITDADANVLQVLNGSTGFGGEYAKLINKALDESEEAKKSIKNLLSDYLAKKTNISSLIALIDKINTLQVETSSLLLNELVNQAPADSASSLTFLLYVIRNAPSIFSDAYKYVFKNSDNGNMAWYRMELRERVRLNNRIIFKSLAEAIQQKDKNKALATARFAQNTHQNNVEEGMSAYYKNLTRYYKGVNDTSMYFVYALAYYDRVMNATNVNEIKKADSLELQKKMQEASTNRSMPMQKFSFAPKAQNNAMILNEGAWDMYKFSKNQSNLKRALNWAKKATDLYQSAEACDTYARLLYVTGFKNEAIEMEENAIRIRKKMQYDSNELEQVLRRMKNEEVIID